ncbi:hypothetical protein IC575_022131 [Cucumis melo]
MGYIGAHGVATLHRYKYSGVDHSYVAKYVLQSFWSHFVYSPHLDSAPSRWVHFAHGLLLFLYQTFDAVGGKQARRTNSSSPQGELFYHDNVSILFFIPPCSCLSCF